MAVGVTNLKLENEKRTKDGLPKVQGLLGPEVLDRGLGIVDCFGLKLYLYPQSRPPSEKK